MIAKDIMTTEVITVSPTTTIKNFAKLLIEHRISGVPVVNAKKKILGMVSEADLLAKRGKEVKDIMSKKVTSIDEQTPVEEIAGLMTTHKIKRVPVIDDGKIVGIVSRADIVRAIALGKHFALHTPIYDL